MLSTYAFVAYSVAAFLMSPVFGVLSDTVGRRSLFLISLSSTSVTGVVMGLVPNRYLFVTSAFVIGATGSGMYALAYAYLVEYTLSTPRGFAGNDRENVLSRTLMGCLRKPNSSVSLQDDLTANFTVLWAHGVLGHVSGLVLASPLDGVLGLRWSMSFAGWTCLPVLLMVYCTLVDTQNRAGHAFPHLDDVLLAISKAIMSPQLLGSSRFLAQNASAYFLLVTVYAGIIDVILFWAEFKFRYYTTNETHQDELFLLVLGSAALAVVLMNRVMYQRLGHVGTIVLVALWSAGASIMLGFAQHVLYTIIFTSLGGVAYGLAPAVMAVMTPSIAREQQGHLQGAVNAVSSLAYIAGPVGFDYIFKHTSDGNYKDGSTSARMSIEANVLWFVAGGFLLVVAAIVYHAFAEANGLLPSIFEPNPKDEEVGPDEDVPSSYDNRSAEIESADTRNRKAAV